MTAYNLYYTNSTTQIVDSFSFLFSLHSEILVNQKTAITIYAHEK